MRGSASLPVRGAVLGATMALLSLAAKLSAQTHPMPALPPPGPAEMAEIDETSLLRGPWEYAVGAGIGRDGNIDFLVPEGPSGMAVVPRAGLTRSFRSRRSELRLSGAGRWIGHPREENLDRYNAAFSLDGFYRPSPATRWQASASYGFGDTDLSGFGEGDASSILVEQGVALPAVKVRAMAAGFGLSQTLGAHTSVRIDGRVYRTLFDSPLLIDGESARSTVGLERKLGARSTGAAAYSLELVRAGQQGRFYLTHFSALQWTRTLSARSAFLLEAGASYTPDVGRAGLDDSASFFGGASFARQVRRASVNVVLRHEVTPAFGSGVSREGIRLALEAVIPMGRAWNLRLDAGYVPGGTQATSVRSPASTNAWAVLGYRVGRRLELSGEARYRRRGALETAPVVEAFRAGVFLTLLSPSGRAIGPAPGF